MNHRRRSYYTEAQEALMWERWQRGDSLARLVTYW
jgi:hypothetical protein